MRSMTNIVIAKQELRQRIKMAKQAFSPAKKALESADIWTQIEAHPRFQSAGTILLFHSLPDEPDTHIILERWSAHKRIILPVVDGERLQLRVYTPKAFFSTGPFGIQEPIGENFKDYQSIDLAIIPGVAFDAEGHRLGRGKGYYDRLIHRPDFCAYTIGVCFSFQLLPSVPTEATDKHMNEVVTASAKA